MAKGRPSMLVHGLLGPLENLEEDIEKQMLSCSYPSPELDLFSRLNRRA